LHAGCAHAQTYLCLLQILQLLCGVISILIYVGMMALTIRFFPIRVCGRL